MNTQHNYRSSRYQFGIHKPSTMSSDEEPQPDAKAEYSDEAEDQAHRSSVLSQGNRESKRIAHNENINNLEDKTSPQHPSQLQQLKQPSEQSQHEPSQEHSDPVSTGHEIAEQNHKKSTHEQIEQESKAQEKQEENQNIQKEINLVENINQPEVQPSAEHSQHEQHGEHEDQKEQHNHQHDASDQLLANQKQASDQEKLLEINHIHQPIADQGHLQVDEAIASKVQTNEVSDNHPPSEEVSQDSDLAHKVSEALLIPSPLKYQHLQNDHQVHNEAQEKDENTKNEHLQTHQTLDDSKKIQVEKADVHDQPQSDPQPIVQAEKQEEAASELKLMRETAPLIEHENITKEEESIVSRRVLAPSIKEKPPKEQELGKSNKVCECSMM